jgi:23S rRNA G2445 N2-methylase RlmL
MQVDRLRLLGGYGTNKIMQGEASRLIGRALSSDRSRQLRETPPRKCGPGAIYYPFQPDLAAVLLCYHRTSARALWDLYETDAQRLEPLYDELSADIAGDPRDWLSGVERISVLAFGTGPVKAGERQIVGTVKNALVDGAARRGQKLLVDPSAPDLVIHARPFSQAEGPEKLSVSVDLLGRPMHRRGYRKAHGPAPLREDLAAQVLFLARYNPKQEAIVDPLAGSGTLLIEAALMAQAAPSSKDGSYPCSPKLLAPELALWSSPLFSDTNAVAIGAELDDETREAFLTNAAEAGVDEHARLVASDFRTLRLDEHVPEGLQTLVVSNPPYGARLEATEAELQKLYRDLGSFCRDNGVRRAAFLVGEPSDAPPTRESSVALFLRSFGGRPRVRKPLSNGPLRAQFLLYEPADGDVPWPR